LIYETSFGSRHYARSAVEKLIAADCGGPQRRAFSYILAAHACERLGINQCVTQIASEAYRLAVECSCGTAAAGAARKLAWAHLDNGDQIQAEHWYQLAVAWVEKGQLSSFAADLYGLQAELLIVRGDYAGADAALDMSAAAWRRTVHARWRLGVLSARCAIWLATGQRARCESAVAEYEDLLVPLYAEEGNELFAARYFLLLASVDRRDAAARELRKYLALRTKSPADYSPALKAVIERLSRGQGDDTTGSTRSQPYEGVPTSQVSHAT
jgi:hypothetical protein